MGPVLHFRGLAKGRCHLAALVVAPSEQPPLTLSVNDGLKVLPEALCSRLNKTVWRYDFWIPASRDGTPSHYSLDTQTWQIYPPVGERMRIAYTACNGTEEDPLGEGNPERYERWRHLASEHARSPFHLLIQGGDQLYADDLWKSIPQLAAWRKLDRKAQLASELSSEPAEAVADFYFEHYCRLWSQPDLAAVLSSIPSLMMWDDHDIFDGWGSHAPALQLCPVFRGVWAAAREQFALFQLASRIPDLPAGFGDATGSHFGWAFDVDGIGIIAPDLRSGRTRTQVMSETNWRWLIRTLARLGHCRRVLFVSSVPVININLSLLERLVVLLPDHHSLYLDDLRDQWRSYAHHVEWLRLVNHLLDFAESTDTPVTILSGEIHLGAIGRVKRKDTQIFQFTSSGIVHPPPPRFLVQILDLCSRRTSTIAPGIELDMLPLPSLGKRYLRARAWLSLDIHPDRSLHVKWHAEGAQRNIATHIA